MRHYNINLFIINDALKDGSGKTKVLFLSNLDNEEIKLENEY